MTAEYAAELRAQAAHARYLAEKMHNREAEIELRTIADALDAQAEEIENGTAANPITLPPEGA